MNFEMWSIWHILYIISPFIIVSAILFLIKKSSNKTKYVIGIILGVLSLIIILIRNIDILINSGWNEEVIPFQVCHIGSIVVGLALILKKKWLILVSFCFNMIPAILAMIFADALVNYDTLLKIRPQTYIWGHIIIVVGALYALLTYNNNFTKKDLSCSLIFVSVALFIAIFSNTAFRVWFDWSPNYFYLYNYKGTPLSFLYNATPNTVIGLFEINLLYTFTLIFVFVAVYLTLYYIANKIAQRNK